jgi:hypothetical protein
MSSFAAASTIPVTNKVAHANSRKSLRIRVITSPMRTAPYTADVPGPAADVMGIPPTLRTTPDGSIGSQPGDFFGGLMFSFCSYPDCGDVYVTKLPTLSRTKPAFQEGGF